MTGVAHPILAVVLPQPVAHIVAAGHRIMMLDQPPPTQPHLLIICATGEWQQHEPRTMTVRGVDGDFSLTATAYNVSSHAYRSEAADRGAVRSVATTPMAGPIAAGITGHRGASDPATVCRLERTTLFNPTEFVDNANQWQPSIDAAADHALWTPPDELVAQILPALNIGMEPDNSTGDSTGDGA